MITKKDKNADRRIRHERVREKVFGTENRPRLNVYRSTKYIYAQVIDDVKGVTLAYASSFNMKSEVEGKTKTIFDLTIAIEIGLVLAVVLFMRRIMENTSISVLTNELDVHNDGEADDEKITLPDFIEVYEIDGPFFFGIANKFEEMARNRSNAKVRIIRMRKVSFIDATGLHNLEIFIDSSLASGRKIVLSGVNENVFRSLDRSGIVAKLGKKNILDTIHKAVDRAFEVAK